MRIGIITYWQSADNYGQQLQCYALQTYLRLQGHDAYLIRYDFINRVLPVNRKKLLKALLVYPVLRAVWRRAKKKFCKDKTAALGIKNKQRHFDDFRANSIQSSDAMYHSLAELQANPPEADVYITGSDQVWSQLLDLKENEAFFLNFGTDKTKRVSYAASYGMDEYPSELNGALKDNLSRFDAISVRENAGVDICNKVGAEATMVLDPTLLLDSDSYRKIEAPARIGSYVYIYSLNVRTADEMYFDEISKYARQRGSEIVVTPASGCVLGAELFEGVEYDYATIPAWLSNIDNADLVVTTSFHGIVFSLLLHTPFVYIPLKGKLSKMNNRAINLLDIVGLKNRIANNVADFDAIVKKSIDWNIVDDSIQHLRQKSYGFLKEAL